MNAVDRLVRDPLRLVRLAALALMLVVITRTQADPDLWGHVEFGRHIATLRGIPLFDTYSFTSDLPWLNHEWLSELTTYFVYALLGSPGLVILKLLLVLGTLALVLRELGRCRMPPALHDALVFLTIAGIAPLATHMRPEMFSLLLFTTLLALLTTAETGAVWPLRVVPALTLLWVNLHGGLLVGMGTLAVWAAMEAVTRQVTWCARVRLCLTPLIALAATLANPYGTRIWTFFGDTVALQRTDISEWLPVFQLGPGMIVLWSLIALVSVLGVVLSERRPWLSHTAIVVMLGFASFRVARLIGFFAVASIMLLSPQIASAWQRRSRRVAAHQQPPTRFAATVVIAVSAIALIGASVQAYRNLTCIQMEEDWSPESAAANFVIANRLQGRMLVWFNWGDYAIYHFSPGIQVSMDGRREAVYSEAVRARHLGFYFDAPENRMYATELNADYIWLQKDLPIVKTLTQQGWMRIFQGTRSIVFAQRGGHERREASSPPQTPRCFPGP
jgi:hypothetical protein